MLNEGVVEDHENKSSLSELLRFSTTKSEGGDQTVSLADYIKRMPLNQKAIYYITADSPGAARSSPHLEIFEKNNVEVLLLSAPVDEWMVNGLGEDEDKPLKSLARG